MEIGQSRQRLLGRRRPEGGGTLGQLGFESRELRDSTPLDRIRILNETMALADQQIERRAAGVVGSCGAAEIVAQPLLEARERRRRALPRRHQRRAFVTRLCREDREATPTEGDRTIALVDRTLDP